MKPSSTFVLGLTLACSGIPSFASAAPSAASPLTFFAGNIEKTPLDLAPAIPSNPPEAPPTFSGGPRTRRSNLVPRFRMPIVSPDLSRDYKLLVKTPDPTVDYKLIVKNTEPTEPLEKNSRR